MSKKIKVLDIYLDTDNPRHDPINDQPEIDHRQFCIDRLLSY